MAHRAEREVEQTYYVRVINPLHWIHVSPKNAVKIGMINKKMYVVTLNRDYEGKETLRVHNLEFPTETVEGETARLLFSRMLFY